MGETLNQIASLLEKHDMMTQSDIIANLLADWVFDHIDKDNRETFFDAHLRGVKDRILDFEEQGC
jgi:hypothetical protein